MKDRIYVCHTFYHVYVSFLKELALPQEKQGKATLVISHMSTDFGAFPDRIRSLSFFEDVVDFDEKGEKDFPELQEYRQNSGFVKNLIQRIKYTKRLAELEGPYIPVNFKEYKEIYVFCDSDPIGYYLNKKHIYYHAMEDGLNCLKHGDLAHYDNRKHFAIKAFLSQKCNLIFIQNGFGKYCLDMEVNDISQIEIPFKKYVEVSRKQLVDRLTASDKQLLLKAFVEDIESLKKIVVEGNKKSALILTEPLCELDVRRQIFTDIINLYKDEYSIILKPHPRDLLDYKEEFPGVCIIDKIVPMEMLNFFDGYKIDLAIGVFTEMSALDFAKEKLRLGGEFMDKYEHNSLHNQQDVLRKEFSKL